MRSAAVGAAGARTAARRDRHTWHHSDDQLFRIVKEGLASIVPGYETDMLTFTRGEQFLHLFALGIVAATLVVLGYSQRRNKQHISAMGISYVVMVTAFYVDNGPKLPFWEQFPIWVFWLGPSLIGWPILVWTLWRRGYRCLT